MGLSVTCRDSKGSGDWEAWRRGVWSEVEPESGREWERKGVFPQCLNV